jgi:hypothetical protein
MNSMLSHREALFVLSHRTLSFAEQSMADDEGHNQSTECE